MESIKQVADTGVMVVQGKAWLQKQFMWREGVAYYVMGYNGSCHALPCSHTDAARLASHWEGFCRNHGQG